MSLPFLRGCSRRVLSISLSLVVFALLSAPARAGLLGPGHWTERNIGPFYVDAEGNEAAARDDLAQVEQVRWVLGGLLEIQELRPIWPMRILLTKGGLATSGFIEQNGQYLLTLDPGARIPAEAVAALLLDENTPRLPQAAESGLRALFSTLQAHGSRVTWGGPPAAGMPADLDFARMQLFATKFEYRASFHVMVTSLKNGSSLRVAERNAFGKDPDTLEKEVEEHWKAGRWEAVAVSGRPLDPKRDLGEHTVDGAEVEIYLASARLKENPGAAEAAFKSGIEAGGSARALGYSALASLSVSEGKDPKPFLDNAMKAGSASAYLYTLAARNSPAADALALLKKAAQLNPKWPEPVYQQVEFATEPAQKEELLKRAAALSPRTTRYWLELARLQASDGHALEAQSSWLRAEDSAATDAERARIAALHGQSEQDRLEAAQQERTAERDATRREDQRARDAEAARIHAAEERANQGLAATGGGGTPQNPVPWDQMEAQKKLTGVLTAVNCGRQSARIAVRDRSGHSIQLTVPNWKSAGLSCVAPGPNQRISVVYAADPDGANQSAGRVLSLTQH